LGSSLASKDKQPHPTKPSKQNKTKSNQTKPNQAKPKRNDTSWATDRRMMIDALKSDGKLKAAEKQPFIIP